MGITATKPNSFLLVFLMIWLIFPAIMQRSCTRSTGYRFGGLGGAHPTRIVHRTRNGAARPCRLFKISERTLITLWWIPRLDYAQDAVDTWQAFLLATSTYILPIAYALLGALFYALRHPVLPRILYRLVIAGVAGFAVSRFSDLLPQDVPLPPLAIAFVVGYSTETLVRRLDNILHRERPS
jgi:hypothetical protein